MEWHDHKKLAGSHAFLGASKYSWLNYDEDKLKFTFTNWEAKQRGNEMHAHAAADILFGEKYGIKRPQTKTTYNMYVNDAIGFRMVPEQVLYFSEFAYGTCDAISFHKRVLRIHDLKTGVTPAHIEQLRIYAALFCLEYGIRPGDITIHLRIYQDNKIIGEDPDETVIVPIMDKIIYFTKLLRKIKNGEKDI